jgi:ferredoxin
MPFISMTTAIWYFIAAMFLLVFGSFGLAARRERQPRAARIGFLCAVAGGLLAGMMAFLPVNVQFAGLGMLGLTALAGVVLFFWPTGQASLEKAVPTQQADERDIPFSRARLVPGSAEYRAYYALHPENQALDDQIRALPGLLSPSAALASPLLFAAPEGSFSLTEALREAVDGPVASASFAVDTVHMTAYLKNLALYFGAHQVGITALQAYHVYSHIGRGSGVYGARIRLDHRFAVAFTVEMDYAMVNAAPNPPIVMESAHQYVEAARVAVQLAAVIRHLGYAARAHIDGNYRVIAPLVARDAGLGEIGRMGLLITDRLGPRVRLGVVTTDLALIADRPTRDASVIDFCCQCQKCARLCPAKAIPFDDRQEIDGALRWRIDAIACFYYWNKIGTDCGRCMAVCPYSHPDSLFHNLVRRGIGRSGGVRRLAGRLDDWIYGEKAIPQPGPEWTRRI